MTTSPRPPGDQAITIPDPDWRQLATCQHAKPEPFFPVYHSLRLGRIRGSGRQGGPSAERAFTAALKARPMIRSPANWTGRRAVIKSPLRYAGVTVTQSAGPMFMHRHASGEHPDLPRGVRAAGAPCKITPAGGLAS